MQELQKSRALKQFFFFLKQRREFEESLQRLGRLGEVLVIYTGEDGREDRYVFRPIIVGLMRLLSHGGDASATVPLFVPGDSQL